MTLATTTPESVQSRQAQPSVTVDRFTRGLVGPDLEWQGPVEDGGTIEVISPPGCWGPMITPKFQGGHEVTQPVYVEGAEVGDAIAVRIESVKVESIATSTGSMIPRDGAFGSDPFVDHKCPECGAKWPESIVKENGEDSIRCAECGANASSFAFEYGFTVVFDEDRSVGLTLDEDAAAKLGKEASEAMALPEHSEQHPILHYHPAEMPGTLGHLRPFIGNIGTTPPIEMPDSHNSGDFGQSLIGADHDWSLPDVEALEQRTDGHMDVNDVRPGAILICPVKVAGGGIYAGDMHANQGDGELSLHTTDVTGSARLQVEVIPDLELDGPLLLPNQEDLPHICQPYTDEEREQGRKLAREYDVHLEEDMGPIQIIGSGSTINDATENAYERTMNLLDMSKGEVRARCTFTGGVKIGRLPGVVQLMMLAPMPLLEKRNLDHLVREQYELS